jgi:hypothetical protein
MLQRHDSRIDWCLPSAPTNPLQRAPSVLL